MSSPQGKTRERASSRKRNPAAPLKELSDADTSAGEVLDNIKTQTKQAVTREWDYKLVAVVITVLAFITRFWRITHPDQVVFDEVHFGKVR